MLEVLGCVNYFFRELACSACSVEKSVSLLLVYLDNEKQYTKEIRFLKKESSILTYHISFGKLTTCLYWVKIPWSYQYITRSASPTPSQFLISYPWSYSHVNLHNINNNFLLFSLFGQSTSSHFSNLCVDNERVGGAQNFLLLLNSVGKKSLSWRSQRREGTTAWSIMRRANRAHT